MFSFCFRYHVAIKYDDFPNDTYYDWKATIPADITHLGPQSEWPEEVRDLPDIEDLLVHTVFPDPRTTNRSGLYKIGIKLAGK